MKNEPMALHRKNVPMEELVPLLQLQMETGGSARLIVTGYSMMPMLHHRKDSVVLDTSDLNEDQVIEKMKQIIGKKLEK